MHRTASAAFDMESITLTAAALTAALLASPAFSADGDLCRDPKVMRPTRRAPCRSEPILYRVDGNVGDAALAVVTTGFRREYDTGYPVLAHFLRTPEGEVIVLGAFPPSRSVIAQHRIYEQLGYNVAYGGGTARTDQSLFYDRLIERMSDAYCLVYRMRTPFVGEFHDCNGAGRPGGEVGYAPGTITVTAAGKAACGVVAAETGRRCETNGVEVIYNAIRRDADGRLHYRVVTRRQLRSFPALKEKTSYGWATPTEYEERTYRIDASDGRVSLLDKSVKCTPRCKPLPPGL
jgi:hypothetical protein